MTKSPRASSTGITPPPSSTPTAAVVYQEKEGIRIRSANETFGPALVGLYFFVPKSIVDEVYLPSMPAAYM